MQDAPFSIRGRLDRAGMLLSGLCAVHCLAGLALVSVLGLGGGVFLSPSIHRVGLALAVLIGATTIGLGAVRHGRVAPLIVGALGLSLMTAGLFVSHGSAEAMLTIAGVVLVASAHLMNLRLPH